MANRADITPELCRQLLRYEPETGKLFWLPRDEEFFPNTHGGSAANKARWNGLYAGKEALVRIDPSGRRTGHILGKRVSSHRVAWMIHYGAAPQYSIDHINGDASDNRITNLRDVDHQTNMMNKWMQKNNTSGANGVSWNKRSGNWEAYIKLGRKRCPLGRWATIEEAKAARYAANKILGFTERHGSVRSTGRP